MKMSVTLDRQSKAPSQSRQLTQADAAQLDLAAAQVTQPERDVGVVWDNFGQEPSGRTVRREQLDHRPRVEVGIVLRLDSVGNQLGVLRRGEQMWPWVSGSATEPSMHCHRQNGLGK